MRIVQMIVGIDVLSEMVLAASEHGASEYVLRDGASLVMDINGGVQFLSVKRGSAYEFISAVKAVDLIEGEDC
jgi:hypothetical protein